MVNLLEDTADFVSSQLNSGTSDLGVLQDVGASLLHGISNVISATSSEAKEENGNEDTGDEKEPGNKDSVQKMKKKKVEKEKVSCLEATLPTDAHAREL